MKMVVSADAGAEGTAARRWCAEHLRAGDEVIAVLGVDGFSEIMLSMSPLTVATDPERLRSAVRQRFETDLAGRDVRCDVRLAYHSQASAVEQAAIAEAADLIVVGKRPHRLVLDTLANETATHLAHHLPCPVLIVPTAARPPEATPIEMADSTT